MMPFWIAVQFLTCWPIRLSRFPAPEQIGQSILYYPWVGLLLGLALLSIQTLLHGATPAIQGALLLAFWVISTGALHLDGLADTADAWIGGLGDRQRTLEIMKDPRSGPMAITVIVLVLVTKFAALQSAPMEAVLLSPWIARALLPLLFLTTAYVRPNGLGSLLARHMPSKAAFIFAGTVQAGFMFLLGGAHVLEGILVGLGIFLCARCIMCRRIGGTTGDTAGAMVELVEAGVLLAYSV